MALFKFCGLQSLHVAPRYDTCFHSLDYSVLVCHILISLPGTEIPTIYDGMGSFTFD